jgi:RNA polymerase sigma factor (sigma-70 family)
VKAAGPTGEPFSWKKILEEHGPAMLGLAAAKLGRNGPTEPGDIVNTIFRKLMKAGPAAFQQHEDPRGYLLRAVINTAISEHRKASLVDGAEPNLERIPAPDDIEREVEHRALALEALDSLPRRERHALVQRVMLKRQAKDVAAELNIAPQYLPRLIAKALDQIRQLPTFTTTNSSTSAPETEQPTPPATTPGGDDRTSR